MPESLKLLAYAVVHRAGPAAFDEKMPYWAAESSFANAVEVAVR
jgi:hypothetical protein